MGSNSGKVAEKKRKQGKVFQFKNFLNLEIVYEMPICLTNYNSENTKETGWWMHMCTDASNYFFMLPTFPLFCKFSWVTISSGFSFWKTMPFVFTNAMIWVTTNSEIFSLVTIPNVSAIRMGPFEFCFVLNCLQLQGVHFLWLIFDHFL